MDIPESRIFGALILLLGVSLFAVGIYTGQLNAVIEMLKTPFRTVIP
jgi:uncharacterized membrane protein YiaA